MAAFLVILADVLLKITVWVLGFFPLRIWMSFSRLAAMTPSSFLNAARTLFLQPAHVTPVMVTS